MAGTDMSRCECGELSRAEEGKIFPYGGRRCPKHTDAGLEKFVQCSGADASYDDAVYLPAAQRPERAAGAMRMMLVRVYDRFGSGRVRVNDDECGR
jgi:hypothetical protein